MFSIIISSTRYNGQYIDIIYYPSVGSSINLGTQLLPYVYNSPTQIDGYFTLINPLTGQICEIINQPVTSTPTPSPTPTPTRTSTPTPSPSRTSTPTPTPSRTSTPTPSPSPTNRPSPTPSVTSTPTPSPTGPTPTPSETPLIPGMCFNINLTTPTPTPTITPTLTITPTNNPTNTLTPTSTPTPTSTNRPSLTPNPTPSDPCTSCNCITFINTGLTSTNVYWLDCAGQSNNAELLSGQTIQVCGSVPSYLSSINFIPFYIGGPCSKVGDVCSCSTDCCQYIVYPSRFGNITLYPIDCNGFVLPSVVITPTGSPYSWCGLKYATSGYYLNNQFGTIRVVELSCPCATPAPTPSVPGNICQINWITTKNTTGVTGCETAEWVISPNNQNIRFNIADSENCGGSCSIVQTATAAAEIVVCQTVLLTITLSGFAEKRNRGFEYIELYLGSYNRIMYAASPGDNGGCRIGPVSQTIEIPGPYLLPTGTHILFIRFTTGDNLYHKDCYYNINLSF